MVMAVALVLSAQVAKPGGGALMTAIFMAIPLGFGVLFSSAWLLAADLLEHSTPSQLTRAYGFIGAASIVGGILGPLLAKVLAMRVEPQAFFLLAAGTLAMAGVLMATAQRICPRRSAYRAGGLVLPTGRDVGLVLREPYTRLLFAIAMLGALAGILIDFQFYLAAATSGNTGRANASFFANYYLVLGVAALLLQLLLLPALQRRFGVYGTLFVLPGALLGGAAGLVATASGFMRSLLRVAEGSLKSSVHRVSWEQAYLPLSGAQRAITKILADGFGVHTAEAAGALIILFWLRFVVKGGALAGQGTAWVGWVLFGVVLLWLTLTRSLGRNRSAVVQTRELDEAARMDIPPPDS
jgi:hypothetical protein